MNIHVFMNNQKKWVLTSSCGSGICSHPMRHSQIYFQKDTLQMPDKRLWGEVEGHEIDRAKTASYNNFKSILYFGVRKFRMCDIFRLHFLSVHYEKDNFHQFWNSFTLKFILATQRKAMLKISFRHLWFTVVCLAVISKTRRKLQFEFLKKV